MERKRIEHLLTEYVDGSLTLGEMIGEGGMAKVYDLKGSSSESILKVIDIEELVETVLKGDAALKELYYEMFYNKCVNRTRQEIEYLWQMKDCPGVTRMISSFEFDAPKKCFFIIQEKYQDLDSFISTQNLTEGLLIQMALEILRVLEILEKKKILHRDIKPGNIFIKWLEGHAHFLLGDFGIAREVHFSKGKVTVVGSYAFQAPELLKGESITGFNSDIFSLGASLYNIATQGKIYIDTGKHVEMQVSKELRKVIQKAIEINPKKRYQHPSQMIRDLQKVPGKHYMNIIFYNKYLYQAKSALLEKDYKKAQYIINEALEDEKIDTKERMACLRILIYIKMKTNNKGITQEELKKLAVLAESGDAVAQYLYGLHLFDNKKEEEGLSFMKRSADRGCEIGCYVYGRILCKGFENIIKDSKKGIIYLESAAKKGYVPAIRILKRMQEEDGYIPDRGMNNILNREIYNYEELKMSYIIPYL